MSNKMNEWIKTRMTRLQAPLMDCVTKLYFQLHVSSEIKEKWVCSQHAAASVKHESLTQR